MPLRSLTLDELTIDDEASFRGVALYQRLKEALRASGHRFKVAAAGVNRPDVRQRQGTYPPPKGATDIPGLEIAGEVVALGPETSRWKIGDKVCALVVGGGYSEYCLAFESHALPVPPSCEHPGTPDNAARPAKPATRTPRLRCGERRRHQRTVISHSCAAHGYVDSRPRRT